MPNSSANRADVRYVVESVWGTTPATPALNKIRITGEGLNAGIQTAVSQELREDRNVSDVMKVGSNAGGNLEFELSYMSFDDLIEAVMGGTWTVDGGDTDMYTLVNGVTERSFTLQKQFADVAQYLVFAGARVNTMSLKIEPNKVVTGSFGVLAKSGVRASSGIAGATYPAGQTTTPMNGAAGVSLNEIDAAPIGGGLMSFGINITNNMRAQDAVGSDAAQAIVPGRFEATGELEVYFSDGTLYDKFASQTAFAAQVKMSDGNGEVWIDVPRAKFETGEVVAQGTDTDVMFKSTFRAIYDATTVGSVKLTKNGPL